MGVTIDFIEKTYPLHYLIWKNDLEEIMRVLKDKEFLKENLEKLDPRGRTPLTLAVILGHQLIVDCLLLCNADSTFTQESGWTVTHEAVSRGDPDILRMILTRRDIQRREQQSRLVPELLQRLKDAPDFYVEMKWEFSSWVPLLTRMLPGQVHRVFKMGANLRIDSSVNGFSAPGWEESAVSLIFKVEGSEVVVMEIDHGTRQVYSHVVCTNGSVEPNEHFLINNRSYFKSVSQRLSSPSVISPMDLEGISFKRMKGSIFGWGNPDKTERVSSYECKVFECNNFRLVTKIRTEHLSDKDKAKTKMEPKAKMERVFYSFGGTETTDLDPQLAAGARGDLLADATFSPEQYFDANDTLEGRDIGRPKEIRTKINRFNATVWLSENYPLNLQEQVMPIVDIMALTNSRFKSLKDFILLQIPSGFPVKLEVPIYHLVNASVTFHNIFGSVEPLPGVSFLVDDNGRLSCALDESIFTVPRGYKTSSALGVGPKLTDDDEFFQWDGLDWSTEEASGQQVDIYEALNAPRSLMRDNTPEDDAEEQFLQRAIEESLIFERMKQTPGWRPASETVVGASALPDLTAENRESPDGSSYGRSTSYDDLQTALAISKQEDEDAERVQRDEKETLDRVLQLSLLEY